MKIKHAALERAGDGLTRSYAYDIRPPELAPGVVPVGRLAPVCAMDSHTYSYLNNGFPGGGFPGYQYLSQLATRAEYRAFAACMSQELTREWIELCSVGEESTDKINAIEKELKRLDVRGLFQRAAEHDCYFGRAQFYIEIEGADRKTPLIIDPRTIPKGSLNNIATVEAIWTTPSAYNALDPGRPDFYKPTNWFVMGQETHATRLLTVITRQLPDMLKPAFNFGGMSLSQLAEPYVDNWLRTRQSVSDLIDNFSTTILKTAMDQVLQGNDDGAELFHRAELFTRCRSNKGLMLVDMERETVEQLNVPLSGLHELQAQSQEHMCSVSRIPAMVLTGISPSGLNASSEGEIRAFYDWIKSQQESYWRYPLEIIIKVIQLSLFGEIDSDITFKFVPLFQLTDKEKAEIKAIEATIDCNFIAAGVVANTEVRSKLANDINSGYDNLELDVNVETPETY